MQSTSTHRMLEIETKVERWPYESCESTFQRHQSDSSGYTAAHSSENYGHDAEEVQFFSILMNRSEAASS